MPNDNAVTPTPATPPPEGTPPPATTVPAPQTPPPAAPPANPQAQPQTPAPADSAANVEQLTATAKAMGFRNPQLAARFAAFEADGEEALKRLSSAEPHLVTPKVNPTNPAVHRQPETLAGRLRNVMTRRRARPW